MSTLRGGGRRSAQALWALSLSRIRRATEKALLMVSEDPGKRVDTRADVAQAESLLRTASDLKGGVAKVAQLMAYLDDPEEGTALEARALLANLFDRVPGVDMEGIRKVFVEDLGKDPEALFRSFEDRPFAAASLGEVHGAVGQGGEDLAIKVQYPGVAEALFADLESERVLRKLSGAAMGGALSRETLLALREAVKKEVDYTQEASFLARFRRRFREDPGLVFPAVMEGLCSGRILCTQRLRGVPISEFASESRVGAEERRTVFDQLFRFGYGAPLIHGVLNADPNPGNFLVLASDKGPRLGCLDFGCATELSEGLVTCERVLYQALLDEDGESLRYCLYREGLIVEAVEFDSSGYRAWERCLAAPFRTHRFHYTEAYARELCGLTSALVRGGRFTLSPQAVLLWRQRLGLARVLGSLSAVVDLRESMLALLRAVDMAPAGVK